MAGPLHLGSDGMKLVVFGLTITSSWGNGHATLWRGLVRALGARGHRVVFFERDVPYYAMHRDLTAMPGHQIQLYETWDDVRRVATRHVRDADVVMVTSYCPDAAMASQLVLESSAPVRAFYDLDTPVTLSRLESSGHVEYVPAEGLGAFDLVLSYTGGRALTALRDRLGARFVRPLYGSVDPTVHRPTAPRPAFKADLSYLGTYAKDRQAPLTALFLEPARRRPDLRFVIGGSMYPESFTWTPNIYYVSHVPPPDHPAFFGSARVTLNVTRAAMAAMGHCPSGRLFEAAACGAPILSDRWDGLEAFFEPGREIFVADTTEQALAALDCDGDARGRMARAARERTLACHTAEKRVLDLERALNDTHSHFELRNADSEISSECGVRSVELPRAAGMQNAE
jgi:spore maturation protein CgeB